VKDLSMYRPSFLNLAVAGNKQGMNPPEVIEQNFEAWLRNGPEGIILYYEGVVGRMKVPGKPRKRSSIFLLRRSSLKAQRCPSHGDALKLR